MKMMALNTYEMVAQNANENGGRQHLWQWLLWTPMKIMALNAFESDGGYEGL